MNLLELTNMVLDEANKGKLTPAIVHNRIQLTLRQLDGKSDWKYLDRFVEFKLLVAEDGQINPKVLPKPDRVMSITFIRVLGADGQYHYLHEIDPQTQTSDVVGMPSGYWSDDGEYLWLNSTPDREYPGQMLYKALTEFSTEDHYEHWLMEHCPMLVFNAVMVNLGTWLREPELMSIYKSEAREQLDDAIRLDEELKYSNKPLAMQPD